MPICDLWVQPRFGMDDSLIAVRFMPVFCDSVHALRFMFICDFRVVMQPRFNMNDTYGSAHARISFAIRLVR